MNEDFSLNDASPGVAGHAPHILFTTQRKMAGSFAIAAAILSLIGTISYLSLLDAHREAEWVTHSMEVIHALQAVLTTATDAETASRGYAITEDQSFLQPYEGAVLVVDAELAQLHALTVDNASQHHRLQSLTALVVQRMRRAGDIIAACRQGRCDAARERIAGGHGKQLHDAIRATVNEMTAAERALLTERRAKANRSNDLALMIIGCSSVLALCIVSLAYAVLRRDFAGARRAHAALQQAQSHLEYLAHHDALTGLPNRSLLDIRLRHTLERARRGGTLCAVLFLDLDGFKEVNDTLGHAAGDELLRLVGNRIRQRLRDNDTLARLAGDEFVIVMEDISTQSNASQMAQVLVEQLSHPFHLATGEAVSIGTSVGISVFPVHADDPGSLMRTADTALYRAKIAGRGRWCFHASESKTADGLAHARCGD